MILINIIALVSVFDHLELDRERNRLSYTKQIAKCQSKSQRQHHHQLMLIDVKLNGKSILVGE